jgi:hypothetical protein
MPDDCRNADSVADGASSPEIRRAAAALRAEVPVRAEWRASVMAEIALAARSERVPPRSASAGSRSVRASRLARLTLAWPIAVAAAAAFFAAGAVAARLAGGPRSVEASRVPGAGVHAPSRRTTRFVLVAPNAQHVALVGDFNLWNPESAPMRRMTGTDEWEIDLPLPAGRHAYAFVVDGDVTADPSAPRTAGDDYGRPNSVVLVASPQS